MVEHLALALSLLAIAGLSWRWVRERDDSGLIISDTGTISNAPVTASPPAPGSNEAAMLEALCQDIRARTSGMVGLAELLVAAPLGEDQQRQAELIADSGRTTIRLLGDVLDVSPIDAAGLQLQDEPTDLREVLEHHVGLMRASARARGLALSLMVDDAVPASVLLDRARLRQVLLNLLGNAIKFTERGSIEVQARLAQTAGGPQLAISVIDPGVGIARERQAEIFEPFFRHSPGPPAAARATSGTGLGLALSSRIVQAMGGEIALESAPGLGSCFTVRLPMVAANERYPLQEDAYSALPGAADIALSGRRVLVAEDHALTRDLLQVMLETLGMVPTLVGNGPAAIDAVARAQLAERPFELVLMDLRMPGLDGLATTRALRAAGHDAASLPVIPLLSAARPHDLTACLAAGMQGHLAKPIDIDLLARTLREVLCASGDRPARNGGQQDPQGLRCLAADPVRLRDLEARYHMRKEALFASLHATLAVPADRAAEADWTGIATQLHRLAGVAANFGDERLGDLVRQLHGELRSQASAQKRHELLARRWEALQAVR